MKSNLKKFYHSNAFVMSMGALGGFLIISVFIVIFLRYENAIVKYLNFKVKFPEPNKVERLYYNPGIDATFIEKWTYSPKKMKRFLNNKDVKKIDVDKVNQIFDDYIENGIFQKADIDSFFDKSLINEENYYAIKIDTENGIVSDDSSITKPWPYLYSYFVLIADIKTNEVYIFEQH
jgi:hypothetical protein